MRELQPMGDVATAADGSRVLTWPALDATLRAQFNARLRQRAGRYRAWFVPMPWAAGGTLTVEVTLRVRWCAIAVDRIRTTNRPAEARAWFEAHVWPVVRAACRARGGRGFGFLPGGPIFAQASPVPRDDVLAVLLPWLTLELTSWAERKH